MRKLSISFAALWAGLGLLAASQAATITTNTVRFGTADSVTIVGTYYAVTNDFAPAVLLLPQWRGTRANWAAFARLLQQNGIAALAIDTRGHGESNQRSTLEGPVQLDLNSFRSRDVEDMVLDVNAAINWLSDRTQLDSAAFAIVGANVTANVALRYALYNDEIAGLILLSPGIVYHELRTDDAIPHLGPVPLRIVVAENDAFSCESSRRLIDLRKRNGHPDADAELILTPGSLHGTNLILGGHGLPEKLVAWLRQVLLGVPAQQPLKDAPSTKSRPASSRKKAPPAP